MHLVGITLENYTVIFCVGRILFFYLTDYFILICKHIINEFRKMSHFLTDYYPVLRLSYMVLTKQRHVTRKKLQTTLNAAICCEISSSRVVVEIH